MSADNLRAIIPANLHAFERTGLAIEKVDDLTYRVSDIYLFFPATGYWRSSDWSVCGYGPGTLIAQARISAGFAMLQEITETPAGRDSDVHQYPVPDTHENIAESAGVPTKLPANAWSAQQ